MVDLPSRGQKTDDRRVRFAHARQKLLEVGKVTEIEERSAVTQESFSRTWNLRSPMFCPLQKTEDRRLTRSLCSR
ncbi:hypothetical protein BES34_015850 [Leptospira inadai serovar Lyme]|uniref:Uncharacterized protein n=1 Tax=Leptospira inadai serovar Lyme TaxID=293084 RepID=A0ABX4YFU4_9LEPT|nr:hypothetical protein BES34_015850 [Leptospira inadai serovar Lyme]